MALCDIPIRCDVTGGEQSYFVSHRVSFRGALSRYIVACRTVSTAAASPHQRARHPTPPGPRASAAAQRVCPHSHLSVLAEVIGQLDDGEWQSRRHHPAIVASAGSQRPYS